MQKRKPGAPRKGWKAAARKRLARCKTWPNCRCVTQGYVNERERNNCGMVPRLRNNPVVGWMSERQTEGILAEIRDEKRRGVW